MSIYNYLIYEEDLGRLIYIPQTIELHEYDNTINDPTYIYSGLTLIFDITGFTENFDISGHSYNNFILNNDVYTFEGIYGETHYFTTYQYLTGSTTYIDPLLTGYTESEIISGFTTNIIPCSSYLESSGNCCPTQSVLNKTPWVYKIIEETDCEYYIDRRHQKGFTLNFVFNRNNIPWGDYVFFYMGVRDEYEEENYGDNNLSFSFTSDGRIKYQSYRYSGYCDTTDGTYTELYYLDTGQTSTLCTGGTSNDFNIIITFERYYIYTDCDLENEGGFNDLIIDDVEVLNKKWSKERNKRLGTLKIYHNGKLLYKKKNFEELILSDRGFQPFIHSIGGGVTGCNDIHNSTCPFQIKYAAYYEDVANYIYIKELYESEIVDNYNIIECNEDCEDNINGL